MADAGETDGPVAATNSVGVTRRSSARQLAALLLGLLVLAGVAVGYGVGASRAPTVLSGAAAVTAFPVTLEPFDDPREVTVVPVAGASAAITARQAGVLTRSTCLAGGRITSGTAPWSVGETRLLALATAVPPHRSFTLGAKGSDVRALQSELNRLGQRTAVDGTYGMSTSRAVSALRHRLGLSPGGSLALEEVVWLPRPQISVTSCLPLGSTVSAGAELVTAGPWLLSASILPWPTGLVPGRRVLVIGGARFDVTAAGQVSPNSLTALAALPETQLALRTLDAATPVPLSGRLVLTSARSSATLPASSVLTRGTSACVVTGSTPVRVEILGSHVGQSVVAFPMGDPPHTVLLSPSGSTACP